MLRTFALFAILLGSSAAASKPLSQADIEVIANLLLQEDTRQFEEKVLGSALRSAHPELRRRAAISIGRIADQRGKSLLESARSDTAAEVVAAVVFATGQLKDASAIEWLEKTLGSTRAGAIEAARALGKIQSPASAAALGRYLVSAPVGTEVVGEALLAYGRHVGVKDASPILKWVDTPVTELQWKVAWAFRNRSEEADVPVLVKLSRHRNAEVRYWAVRKLVAATKSDERVREAMDDPDRRVRAEATRALGTYDDDASFARLLVALESPETWVSIFAAEAMARFESRAKVIVPNLIAPSNESRPLALRLTIAPILTRLDPGAGKALVARLPPAPQRPTIEKLRTKTIDEYRRIVAKWVVPDYMGKRKPVVVFETPNGRIEMELYAGDAPLGTEYMITSALRGDIDGTVFGRVVPNFVAQQRPIRGVSLLRDEVSLRPLDRGNLSWASRGLDTGPPGYTLGLNRQAHNEGNFTSLGRVIVGMDVVERLELGDSVVKARVK